MYYQDRRVEVNDALTRPDGKCEATLAAMVNYFQNCCLFQSEDLGVGFKYLTENHIGWVLNNWQIDVERFPEYAEKIRIYTNPYSIKSFMGMRNFFIEDEQKNIIVKANSIWTLLNLETVRPCKVPDKIINSYEYEEKLDMEYAPRKIDVPEGGQELKEIEILPQHLDMNMHVNNGQYISMALSCLPIDFKPYHLRAEYRNQVRLGEKLTPTVISVDDSAYYVTLKNESGEVVTVVEFKN